MSRAKKESEEPEEADEKGSELWDFLRDVIIAVVIVGVVIGGIFAYSGIWPPLVVIDSGSMKHGENSSVGTIDAGDLVLVKEVLEREDMITYIEGRESGHQTYGDYGDVIVYRKYGSEDMVPIIHRAMMWLEYNASSDSFDIPDLQLLEHGTDWYNIQFTSDDAWYGLREAIVLKNVGYQSTDVIIDLGKILDQAWITGGPHGGFITMGDGNLAEYGGLLAVDQHSSTLCSEPIQVHWIVGKARGELPWFGAIKLYFTGDTKWIPSNTWTMLAIAIVLIIAIPVAIDMLIAIYSKRKKADEEHQEHYSIIDRFLRKRKESD